MKITTLSRFCVPLLGVLVLGMPAAAGAQGVETPRIPLRTALNEISALRVEYATALNKKDVPALTALYAPDAVIITANGKEVVGRTAISAALAADTASGTVSINSDTVRVFGHTAWDIGTVTSGGSTQHYLVVLRRGLTDWLITSIAVVPETNAMVGSK